MTLKLVLCGLTALTLGAVGIAVLLSRIIKDLLENDSNGRYQRDPRLEPDWRDEDDYGPVDPAHPCGAAFGPVDPAQLGNQ